MEPDRRITRGFVGLLLGGGLVAFLFYALHPVVASLFTGILAFETWTIGNRREGDTISEVVWEITDQRPLLPFAVGIGTGFLLRVPPAGLTAEELAAFILVVLAWGVLCGHFFFARYGR